MKLLSVIFSLILLWLLSVQNVFAIGGFSFDYGSRIWNAGTDIISSWQGSQTISPNKIFAAAPPDFKNSLLEFVGQPPALKNPEVYYRYNLGLIYNYINGLSPAINADGQEPKLQIQNNKVTEFTPPQIGKKLDVYQSALGALKALEMNQNSAELIVYETEPKTSLAQTNSLGINELVGEGISNFAGSPKNRRFNIAAGIEKFKGVVIPQGATFSFDDILGPVEANSGFLPELVIKGAEGTIPEFGGGLCQVSTTTFRAAMQAGVPITQRRNHAYAVQYYSPQGTDATIYPGSADLKFINDTPGAILIWPYEKDSNTLVFDFYGTNDGRKVTLEKPVVYDRQPDGSMKATWTRLVALPGQPVRTDVFNSTYQSPALFHKVEQFVSTSTTPPSNLPTSNSQPNKLQ